MTTNTEGLKPCPCCQSADTLVFRSASTAKWVAWCNDCELQISKFKRQDAIEAWNRRPTAQASEAIRNAALEEAAQVAETVRIACFASHSHIAQTEACRNEISAAIRVLSTMPAEPVTSWQPIESAPEMTECVVRWMEDGEVRHALDYKEENMWSGWAEHYEHFIVVAKPEGSVGPKETPPYTHYMSLAASPTQSMKDE